MNILLLAFALPVAIIILSVVLQKILRCPLLVAATFFAILLIVAFAVFDASFLVFVILYTILSYVTAALTRLICNIISRLNLHNEGSCVCGCNRNSDNNFTRNSDCNVASGTWRCTTRNIARTGVNQIPENTLADNNDTVCTCNNNDSDSNGETDPMIILANTNNVANSNGNNARNRRNECNCNCNRR